MLTGNCQSPTDYVVLGSRCGGTAAEPKIKLDSEIEIEGDKTFYDYMFDYTRAYGSGVQEAYKKLGYTIISTAKNITVIVDGKEVKKSLKDLYFQYVTAEVLGLELAEGENSMHPPATTPGTTSLHSLTATKATIGSRTTKIASSILSLPSSSKIGLVD